MRLDDLIEAEEALRNAEYSLNLQLSAYGTEDADPFMYMDAENMVSRLQAEVDRLWEMPLEA